MPHEHATVHTSDGVTLGGRYLPGPGGAGAGPAVAILHGFGGHHRKPRFALLAERVAGFGAVLTVDLRGHGRSGGRCTLGDREELDAVAAHPLRCERFRARQAPNCSHQAAKTRIRLRVAAGGLDR